MSKIIINQEGGTYESIGSIFQLECAHEHYSVEGVAVFCDDCDAQGIVINEETFEAFEDNGDISVSVDTYIEWNV